MEKYLSKGIKEVIAEFPDAGKILDEYQIACTTCDVGTCLLKQVVEIHTLPPDQEAELMDRIEQTIYPDRKPAGAPAATATVRPRDVSNITYSPPVQRLVDEHGLIKRLIALIPWVIANMKRHGLNKELISQCLDFIRSYADRYHHAKEEDILFSYASADNKEIIQAMYEDHATGRNHVKAVDEALATKDLSVIEGHLDAYGKLLTDHIKKEDELLYPWIDRNLTENQVADLEVAFARVDEELGLDIQKKYESFINRLESKTRIMKS